MNNITIRQGETLQIPVTIDDDSAERVTLQVISGSMELLSITDEFVDGQATISVDELMLPLGTYEYMLTVFYVDGVIDKLPDVANCSDDDCSLPSFKVCEGIFESAD